MKANIVEIKKFAIHDGDGIRTTVFFKGCPLKCLWCHNPESISPKKQLAFYSHMCIGCKKCQNICFCHKFEDGIHTVDCNDCNFCYKCVDICHKNAIKIYGEEMPIEKICEILIKDIDFYKESGGGITLSGGECLLQPNECVEILKKVKLYSINTAIDTCGFVSREAIKAVMPYADTFLYDIKAIDESIHKECTGQSNKIILENLEFIDSCKKNIEIRIPYVPGLNDNQIEKIAKHIKDMQSITKVRVLPYHNYAGSKYNSINMKNTLPNTLPSEEEIAVARSILKSYGLNAV